MNIHNEAAFFKSIELIIPRQISTEVCSISTFALDLRSRFLSHIYSVNGYTQMESEAEAFEAFDAAQEMNEG